MTTRVREFSKIQSRNEKLLALGKLSAGLAHELNNPASAMARSAKTLKEHLKTTPDKFKRVIKVKLSEEIVDVVNDLMYEKLSGGKVTLTTMQKANIEDDIEDYLEDEDISTDSETIEHLASFGFTVDEVEEISTKVEKEHAGVVLDWIGSNIVTETVVEEIEGAASRISHLIGSIKTFSYMDQSLDFQQLQINDGLESTGQLLNHKVKKKNISITLDLDKELPKVYGLPGELNQVWMNLISNAIDAVEPEKGEIVVCTRNNHNSIVARVIDNGSGIPDDIKSRIFEPFYTTKRMGEGTGLGLDIVKKIIEQHKGDILLNSKPGRTEFEVYLPTKPTT